MNTAIDSTEKKQIQRDLLKTIIKQIETDIKEHQKSKILMYYGDEVYRLDGVISELISLKIRLEKWRKKLSYND